MIKGLGCFHRRVALRRRDCLCDNEIVDLHFIGKGRGRNQRYRNGSACEPFMHVDRSFVCQIEGNDQSPLSAWSGRGVRSRLRHGQPLPQLIDQHALVFGIVDGHHHEMDAPTRERRL